MINDIRLQNFRSYTDDSYEFSPEVNIIIGPNASGKTNILEAIMVNSLGKSYRAKDTDLIQFDKDWARVDCRLINGRRTVKITKTQISADKTFEINNLKIKRLTTNKTLPIVLFEPNNLLILTGSPDVRREYIDNLLEQTVFGFSSIRKQYKRTLSQRNRLLKQGPLFANTQIFAWNIRLSQLGSDIANQRNRLIQNIAQKIEQKYQEISKTNSNTEVKYDSQCNLEQYSSDMLHKLEKNLNKDFERGFTSVGPHRDDMTVLLNGHRIEDAASRGESRTMMLCFKTIEMGLLYESRDVKPILLLDDVFSELDGSRRRALTESFDGHQAFITTTDADVVVEHFLDSCNVIPLGG